MHENEIRLTEVEIEEASRVGELRYTSSRQGGVHHIDLNGRTGNQQLQGDIQGACAEYAFCKWRRCYWERHVGTFHRVPDVFPAFEVRSTHHVARGRLRVTTRDHLDRLFVLVLVDGRTYIIRGWMGGLGATRDEWWDDPNGRGKFAWFVPQSDLFDPACLRLQV